MLDNRLICMLNILVVILKKLVMDDDKKNIKVLSYFRRMNNLSFFLLSMLFLIINGCSSKQNGSWEEASNLTSQHILVVISKLNRNPDVIEDWTDYKRYTWRYCKTQDMFALGIRNDDAYYLKPKVVCCNIEFDTDRNNLILGSKGLDVCPVSDGLSQSK
ncbi:hypothetical protein DM558_10660 [Entomomonas moraniae]|uniref:Uncharacterized protein n=1 Tax=Entomomonas moraniae TaxID=2213226 RepID=A0A3Q9JJU6_9GAMM|nr:hypothetical protein [Entomomonas moraniae]AZS51199.1 hypothetical protein DM558_10660 [Entomomonas moraniae]